MKEKTENTIKMLENSIIGWEDNLKKTKEVISFGKKFLKKIKKNKNHLVLNNEIKALYDGAFKSD